MVRRQGVGVVQNHVEAHKWLDLAANMGEAAAAKERDAVAAKMTPKQLAEARQQTVSKLRAAAERGLPQAMLALGRLYVQGQGMVQDYVEARKWLNLAAGRGVAEAERDAVAAKMAPVQVAKAQERAMACPPSPRRRSPDSAARRSRSSGSGRPAGCGPSAWWGARETRTRPRTAGSGRRPPPGP